MMLVLFFLMAAVATAATDDDLLIRQAVDKSSSSEDDHAKHEFSMFKSKFNKSYATQEEHDYRFGVFKKDLEWVEKMNKINKAANRTYKLGIQYFSDLTREERHTGCAHPSPFIPPSPTLLQRFLHNLNLVLHTKVFKDNNKNQILQIKIRPVLSRGLRKYHYNNKNQMKIRPLLSRG